jgi:ATP-binding cassette subfamily C protein
MEQIRKCLSLLDAEGRRQLARLGLQIFVSSILEMLSVSMILPFLALMGNPNLLQTSRPLHAIFAAGDFTSREQFMIALGSFLFSLVLAKNIYLFIITKRQAHFCHTQAARISAGLLNVYLHAPFRFHLTHNSANLINTTDHAVDQTFAQVMMPFLIFVTEASALLAILLLLLFVEPMLTLSLGLLITICATILILALRRRLSFLGVQVFQLRVARLKTLQQALASIKEIRVFGREDFFLSAFQRVRYQHAEAQTEADSLAQTPRQVLEVIIVGGMLLVIVAVLLEGRANADVVKILGLFAMAAFRLMPGANRLVTAYNNIKHGTAYLDETITDYFDPTLKLQPGNDTTLRPDFAKSITFDHVSFRYQDAPSPALADISFSVARGEALGLVGASGAGKSTLVDVALGLLTPQTGRVLVDDRDLTGASQVWRHLAGYVPQSVSLIDDTLLNNIAFGVEPDAIDAKKAWQALEKANLAEFCLGLLEGLQTELGERGVRMSGGQRQRVGIARALYRDPAILIFDEATAALDNESEREITRAIEMLHGSKTMIIIAHRLSTVRKCDRLLVMKHGSIIANGTFDSLLRTCPEFSHMVKLAELTSDAGADLALH